MFPFLFTFPSRDKKILFLLPSFFCSRIPLRAKMNLVHRKCGILQQGYFPSRLAEFFQILPFLPYPPGIRFRMYGKGNRPKRNRFPL